MSGAFFVTGTDTAVGKTFITAGLAGYYANMGQRVGVMKPIETGHENDQNWPEDALTLHQAAQNDDPRDIVVPYIFSPPVSPWAATQITGRVIDFPLLIQKARDLMARYSLTFIEGAGGLAVPIDEKLTMADIPRRLDIPIIIVSRSGLGTINHTVLTVEYARMRGLDIRGIVMNQSREQSISRDPSHQHNRAIIEKMTGVPVIGMIPIMPTSHKGRDLSILVGEKIRLNLKMEGA